MENIPIPFEGLIMNSTSSIEKRVLACKTIALSSCILGTAVNLTMKPEKSYIGGQYFDILIPAFISGYIIIHISEILAIYMKEEHIFMEMCFAVVGIAGNGAYGVYQFCKWIQRMVYSNNYSDLGYGYKAQNFILFIAGMLNILALIFSIIFRIAQRRIASH